MMVILFNALFYARRSPPLRNGYQFPGRWKSAKKRRLFSPASDPMVSNSLPTDDNHVRLSGSTTALYKEVGESRREKEGQDMNYQLAHAHSLSASFSIHNFYILTQDNAR